MAIDGTVDRAASHSDVHGNLPALPACLADVEAGDAESREFADCRPATADCYLPSRSGGLHSSAGRALSTP